jgi:hypothetical protein
VPDGFTAVTPMDREPLSRVSPFATMVVGAAAGLALGYLYLTDDGRRLRARVDPWLDQCLEEIRRFRAAALKARRAWYEGRDSIDVVRHIGQAPRETW